jgi:hypothetical protein
MWSLFAVPSPDPTKNAKAPIKAEAIMNYYELKLTYITVLIVIKKKL